MIRPTRPPRPRQSEPEPSRPLSQLARSLRAWFAASARDLPWRAAPAGQRPLYLVLVSELMLQQTQVSRVLEVYPRFMRRFPTLGSLARADESDVLAAWTGLGYYRRARNLHSAALAIARDHAANLPPDPRAIRALPGVGEYTTGAIASLCFDLPIPAVDTNVQRVLQRLCAHDADPKAPSTLRWARDKAMALHMTTDPRSSKPTPGSGILNEALIELGALICTPRAPKCDRCPLRSSCLAHAKDLTDSIPRPRPAARRMPVYCASVLVKDPRGRLLIEQRPDTGLWSTMHQAPTIERPDRPPSPRELRASLAIAGVREHSRFKFQTTHRDLSFIVYEAMKRPGARLAVAGRCWVAPNQLHRLALSSPQRRILALSHPRA